MKIASFNVKRLGIKKLKDEEVKNYLIKIVSRYSIIVILEVVDTTGKAMDSFLKDLNRTRANRKHPYKMVKSPRVGRTTYKEQYVCFYRPDQASLKNTHLYEDDQEDDEDVFSREPFILHFKLNNTMLTDLVLIAVHISPFDSMKELDELDDVRMHVYQKWKTMNQMFLGDFNADGSYISKKKLRELRICNEDFHWLIDDDVDTTVSLNNDYTYDRIVVYKDIVNTFVPKSAKSFDFHKAYDLSKEMALKISDHYPVEVSLKRKPKVRA